MTADAAYRLKPQSGKRKRIDAAKRKVTAKRMGCTPMDAAIDVETAYPSKRRYRPFQYTIPERKTG